MDRCEALAIQVIITEYDEDGRAVGEKVSNPQKVFRVKLDAFLKEVDEAVAKGMPPEEQG
jgi:hypothetical protein